MLIEYTHKFCVFVGLVTGWCQGLFPPHLQSQWKVPWRRGCCITPSPCAKPLCSLLPSPHIIFVLFLSPVLPPVSPVPPCHSLLCPLFCVNFVILITLITSYTLYVSPLLCALLYRHFSVSFRFSLLGNPLLWSKH